MEGYAAPAGIWGRGGVIVTVNAGNQNWRQGCPRAQQCPGPPLPATPSWWVKSGDTVTVHSGNYSFHAERQNNQKTVFFCVQDP